MSVLCDEYGETEHICFNCIYLTCVKGLEKSFFCSIDGHDMWPCDLVEDGWGCENFEERDDE